MNTLRYFYHSDLSIWLSVDPMAEERPSLSPYSYCQNNPIGRSDKSGLLDNPIYDLDGNFLGTDDLGLQGEAIVMNKDDFEQGMFHKDALSKGTLRSNLPKVYNKAFYDKIDNHFSILPKVAGQGIGYEINIYGSKKLKPILPWIK